MAISVYLDTHHISRMASGQSDLTKFISDPRLSFVFSTSHVVECLPKEPRENAGAISRLNIIMGPNAKWLRGWGKVASLERSCPAVELQHLFCGRHDMLFSNFKLDRSEFVKRAREDLKKILKARFQDQNQRRSIQAKLVKNGKLTAEAFKIIKEQSQGVAARASEDFRQATPLLGAGGLYDFLEGKVSEREFREKFMDSLADPVALATMSSTPELSSILDFSRFFWMQMDDLSSVISKFVVSIRDEVKRTNPADRARVRSQVARGLNQDEFRKAIIRRIAGVEIAEHDLARMTGTRFFADLFSQYILEKIDRYANPASADFIAVPDFLRSDIADFTHVFYYPYVDIFGCDGAMRERMKKANWSIGKVATTDRELESKVIEMRLG